MELCSKDEAPIRYPRELRSRGSASGDRAALKLKRPANDTSRGAKFSLCDRHENNVFSYSRQRAVDLGRTYPTLICILSPSSAERLAALPSSAAGADDQVVLGHKNLTLAELSALKERRVHRVLPRRFGSQSQQMLHFGGAAAFPSTVDARPEDLAAPFPRGERPKP